MENYYPGRVIKRPLIMIGGYLVTQNENNATRPGLDVKNAAELYDLYGKTISTLSHNCKNLIYLLDD